MTTRFAKFMKSLSVLVLVLVLLLIVKTECMPVVGPYPSRCANLNCLPQPSQNCWKSFDQDDGCCPVWHCSDPNGNTFVSYGKGGANGGGSSIQFTNTGGGISSSSFSSSSSFGPQQPPPALPSFNFGGGGFPFGGGAFPPFSFPSLGGFFG